MLDGKYLPRFGEVEHIEDNGFRAAVFATMNRAYYFHQRLAFMEGTLVSVLTDNRQFTLLHDTVVNGCMVMPAGNSSYRNVMRNTVNSGLP